MKKTKRFASCALVLGSAILLFVEAETSMAYIRRGMSLCVRTMIPSLFPFMVVSELIVRSGVGEAMARLPARLLRLPEGGVCACLLGFLCGFPVGSRVAAEYYRMGRLTPRQFNVVLSCCNVPSSAFLVCAVGLSLFGSRIVGWGLVALTLAASFVSGTAMSLFLPREKRAVPCGGASDERTENIHLSQILPQSISSAATGMLGVCATVLLFSAVIGAVNGLWEGDWPGDSARAVLLGVFEMSGGVCAVSRLPDAHTALALCAAMTGWGGLSVHCQIFTACTGCPLDVRVFWLARGMQALVCGGSAWLWMQWFPITLPNLSEPMAWRELLEGRLPLTSGDFRAVWTQVCCIVLGGAILLTVGYKIKNRRERRRDACQRRE